MSKSRKPNGEKDDLLRRLPEVTKEVHRQNEETIKIDASLERLPETEPLPALPKRTGASRPHILLVDDHVGFLEYTEISWNSHYQQDLVLHTICPSDQDNPVTWIKTRLENEKPLDAVFLDWHIPKYAGKDILHDIKELKAAKYLPVVMIAANPEAIQPDADQQALALGAQRFMYKHTREFLYHAALIIPQLRDAEDDEMWVDIIKEFSQLSAKRQSLDVLLERLHKELTRHFGVNACYARELDHSQSYLKNIFPSADVFSAGEEIELDTVPPFMQSLLSHDDHLTYRADTLAKNQIGNFPKLAGLRVLGASIIYGKRRLGTLTLYRQPHERTFRRKDEKFLSNLAMVLGTHLGMGRDKNELRQRQTDLLLFVDSVSKMAREDEIIDHLGTYLHDNIQENDDLVAKTTVRILDPGRGTLDRCFHRGIPVENEDFEGYIDRQDSTYCYVVREGKTLRFKDVESEAKGRFIATVQDITSSLTVPLLASGLCLGGVNLENRRKKFYSSEDESYVEAMCLVAAEFLFRLRAQRFEVALLKLVEQFSKASTTLISEAYSVLYDFTGFSRLVYLTPTKNSDAAWKVESVVGPSGCLAGEEEISDWQIHVRSKWTHSWLARCLVNPTQNFVYTSESADFESDEPLAATGSQGVLVLFGEAASGKPVGMLSFHFRMKAALNPYQRDLLEHFARFVGRLVSGSREMKRIYDDAYIAKQIAKTAVAFSDFEHVLNLKTGAIGNKLELIRRTCEDQKTIEVMDQIQAILDKLDQNLKGVRFLARLPVRETIVIEDLWDEIIHEMQDDAKEGSITFEVPLSQRTLWKTDKLLLKNIIINLVVNSIQHAPGSNISLLVQKKVDMITLSLSDTGPGVLDSVRRRMFESGVTTRPDGTGRGLLHARLMTESLGGTIEHDHHWKQGARFVLRLPKLDVTQT